MKHRFFALTLILLLLLGGCAHARTPSTESAATATPTDAATVSPAPPATAEAPAGTEAPATTETRPGEPTSDAVHPMLFRVTDENGQEMYLFGTIHAGDARSKLALQQLTPVLDGCDALAVEFDIVAYETNYPAQLADVQQFLLDDGTTVDAHMPAELYERAVALVAEARLKPNIMKYYKLSWWSQLVDQAALISHSSLDLNAGMDRYLIQYCYDRQIEVRDVESSALQYGLVASFSDALSLLLIEYTLDNLDSYGEEIERLYSVWLEGNYEHIAALLSEEDESQQQALTQEQKALLADYNDRMLTRRNLGMRDRALEWMQAGDKVFFAVGAAHLVGEDGLVELLRAAGCTVEQINEQG